MAYNYDALYAETEHALGDPTQIFVDFFNNHQGKSLRVLDIGCGQGRDALFIARLGHSVVGVDLSPNGIRDMSAIAAREELDIEGIVANIVTFEPSGTFDIILIDRTLHMLPEVEHLAVLKRLIGHVSENGWVLLSDERSNVPGFKHVFEKSDLTWETRLEAKGNLFVQRV